MAENNITQADVERLINSLRIPQKLKELLLKKPSMLTPVEEVTVSSLQEVYPVLKSIPKSPEETYLEVEKNLLPFLKKNEGLLLGTKTAVEDKGKKDPTKDIGYGHKLTAKERKTNNVYGIDISKGITPEQAEVILKKDIANKYKQASTKVPNFSSLSPTEQALVTDFEFNVRGGIKSYPKLMKAIQNKDTTGIHSQYKRYMGSLDNPLKLRNQTTLDNFIIPMGREYESSKAATNVASNPNPEPRAI